MALFGLGLSAIVKGASGLFKAVKNKVKDFRAKRKADTQSFKDEIKAGFGGYDPYQQGAVTTSFNASPTPQQVEAMQVDLPGSGGSKRKDGVWYRNPVVIGGGIVGILGLIFAAARKKRRR